jgi:hypothetical protein
MGLFTPAVIAVLAFTLLDMVYAWSGLRFEERKDRKLIWYVPLQRVYYLVVYAVIVPAAFLKALDGSRTRWNKLKRRGSAQALYNELTAVQPVVVHGIAPGNS